MGLVFASCFVIIRDKVSISNHVGLLPTPSLSRIPLAIKDLAASSVES